MKANYIIGLFVSSALLCSSCKTMTPQNKQMFAMQTGGMIGSVSGSLVGDRIGGWGGSLIGSVVGGVAGSALGAAAANPYKTQPQQNNVPEERHEPQLVIRDILLTDENKKRDSGSRRTCASDLYHPKQRLEKYHADNAPVEREKGSQANP